MRPFHRQRIVVFAVIITLAAAVLAGAYALAGSAPATTRQSAPLWLETIGTTKTGHTLLVSGGISVKADLGGAVIKIYKREAGHNTDTCVGQAKVTYALAMGNTFSVKVPRLKRNCIITAVWRGNSQYFGSRTWAFAGVTPKLTLTAPIATQEKTRLRIRVDPVQPSHAQGITRPGQLARIECLVDGVWTDFPGELGVESTDGETYSSYNYFTVPAGTYTVRASFRGTNYNAASVSKTLKVVVP